MSKSYSLIEMEQIELDKQKEGRKIIDQLYKLYVENGFIDFNISKIENGYNLESEEILYLFHEASNDYSTEKLTVIQKGYPQKTFTSSEILEERTAGGLKVSLGEFFVYLPTLIDERKR